MVNPMIRDDIEAEITNFYLNSSDFNGLPAIAIIGHAKNQTEAREALEELVRNGRVTCAFASVSLNPHIKRFPDLSAERQLALLSSEGAEGICLYPCPDAIRERFDVSKYNDRPFSQCLLLGGPQLQWRGFDLGVLDRYYNDPRYVFQFYDFAGTLSIREATDGDSVVPERDQVFLQTFGIGYDEAGNRVAVVFLRYLADLSPEHQQYWRSFICPGVIKLHPEYYRSSYLGEWPVYGSYFKAILIELKLLNELTKGIFGQELFRTVPGDDCPANLTPFLRPTLRNFNAFVLAMDKLLSENVNRKFFEGQLSLEYDTPRPDGKIVVTQKGTLRLLEEWLRRKIRWDNEEQALKVIVGPLKHVRALRQGPAHKIEEDQFSKKFNEQQHAIVRDVYEALSQLRYTLSRHPRAPRIEIPDWIEQEKIAFDLIAQTTRSPPTVSV
jgi:hypothetical protein